MFVKEINAACLAVLLLLGACTSDSKEDPENVSTPALEKGVIKVNQVGFDPTAVKAAVIPVGQGVPSQFQIVDQSGRTVFTGAPGLAARWSYSEEDVVLADFSQLDRPGNYRVVVDGIGESHPFEIKTAPYRDLAAASIKALYYSRCSTELETEHAGPHARPAGHPDDQIVVHASAASAERPEGSTISSPGGWYDAGDYNKYIVNSAFTVYTLLAAYEHHAEFYDELELNIPESGDGVPDILDETLWNLKWMRTMQDPSDGGVYHKLSSPRFEDMIMPHQCGKTRYVVQKTTAAALNYAAVMAAASRILLGWPDMKALADDYLNAALAAWNWALKNPSVLYRQPEGFITGTYAYEHEDLKDEFFWAACEIFITTGDQTWFSQWTSEDAPGGVPSWDYVGPFGWMSLAFHGKHPQSMDPILPGARLKATADFLTEHQSQSAYGVAMGAYPRRHMEGPGEMDFSWGGNSRAAAQGMILLNAHRIHGHEAYKTAAMANLDYLLGRNATGYCFVTGFGTQSPMNLHYRIAEADGVIEPPPGWLAGGPQAGQQDLDDCGAGSYPSNLPALSYLDHVCSYASNENAINWNATLAYLAGAVTAVNSPEKK